MHDAITCLCFNEDSTDVMSELKCLKLDCKSFGHLFASKSRLQKHVRRMHDEAANVNCGVPGCSYFTVRNHG